MKKIIALLLTLLISLCLISCSNQNSASDEETTTTTKITTTRLETEKATIKDSEAIELIKSYSPKELGLTEKDMQECSFMIAKYGETIDNVDYVKVVATVKTEHVDNGETTYTLENRGEYYISFDGKTILSKNLTDGTYSNLEVKQKIVQKIIFEVSFMAKKKSLILIMLVLIALCVGTIFGLKYYKMITNDKNGVAQENIDYTLVIESKDFEPEVAQKLFDSRVIASTTAWTSFLHKNYPNLEYINGEYYVNAGMTYDELANKLMNPDISHKTVKVCIPEGTNCMEIAKILEKNEICKANKFLEVCKSKEGFEYDFLETVPDSPLIAYQLEGFLFPATYDLGMNSDPHDVADTMLDAFDLRITDEMTAFCEQNYMTMFELITLASVVQEEALGQSSAKNIASVFMNRLDKGAKLQSDVTYFYARDLRDNEGFSQDVYDAYYTYRCDGLPAGPITNSGADIVSSTVNYPKTDYLYFFSDLKDEFHFASTYDEFVSLQKKYPWK